MDRRNFIKLAAAGMAAGWAFSRWPGAWPVPGRPAGFALLADAHLPDGRDKQPEARSLARAVAEIKALDPAPDLVLFAGDLAHGGDPGALALGVEILSDLAMPVLAVRGEGDGRPGQSGAGRRLFQGGRFCYACNGVNVLGLDTAWQDGPPGPGFVLGEPQKRWLAEILPRLDPAAPLIVLSHAPLASLYRPWGQWTRDSAPMLDRLARCRNVFCLHGHVHHSDFSSAGKSTNSFDGSRFRQQKTENRKPTHLALPATSWPLPSPLTGTPAALQPGIGPRGCGWALLQPGRQQPLFHQVLWRA
jgi:Icc protein